MIEILVARAGKGFGLVKPFKYSVPRKRAKKYPKFYFFSASASATKTSEIDAYVRPSLRTAKFVHPLGPGPLICDNFFRYNEEKRD